MSDLPDNLRYTAEHEWVTSDDPVSIGITAHAAEELGEIVYVELPAIGANFAAGDVVGEIESTKAVSEIYAPVSGEIVEVNDSLEAAPETVGEDPYGDGWLFRMRLDGPAADLIDADAYRELIS